LDAFFVLKSAVFRQAHFWAFENVVDGPMLWAEAASAGVKEFGVGEALTHEAWNTLQIPAGVDGAETTEVQEEWEAFHPFQPFGPFVQMVSKLGETDTQTAVAIQPSGT
jgi:hypothetical protein